MPVCGPDCRRPDQEGVHYCDVVWGIRRARPRNSGVGSRPMPPDFAGPTGTPKASGVIGSTSVRPSTSED